jgi:hypothetical protein
MKDALLLLGTAAGVSLFVWIIWQLLGKDGLSIFSTFALLITLADNIRLRRKLKGERKN